MSDVTVSIKMTAKQSGALYMKNIALEEKIATLEAELSGLRSVAQSAKDDGVGPDLCQDNFR
jgi:hypothetical protein